MTKYRLAWASVGFVVEISYDGGAHWLFFANVNSIDEGLRYLSNAVGGQPVTVAEVSTGGL